MYVYFNFNQLNNKIMVVGRSSIVTYRSVDKMMSALHFIEPRPIITFINHFYNIAIILDKVSQ